MVLVLAHEGADGKHGLRADHVDESRSHVKGSDLGTLVRGANQLAVGAQPSVVHHQAVPGRGILRVEGIGGLKPRTRVAQVQLDRVCIGEFIVHAVEKVLFVPFIVHDRVFRGIEEAAGLQPAERDKIPPVSAAIRQVGRETRRAEAAVRCGYTAVRLINSQTGARRHLDDQARLVSKFRRRCAGDYFHATESTPTESGWKRLCSADP